MSTEEKKHRIARFFISENKKLIGYVSKYIDNTAEKDVEDIVQDVMLNFFERPNITIPVENLSAYIYRSLRNKAIDFIRKKKLSTVSLNSPIGENGLSTLADVISDANYNIEDDYEKKEMRKKLFSSIEKLDAKDKAIIIATEFESKSYKELSKEWNISVGTLLARKSRALKKMRENLEN